MRALLPCWRNWRVRVWMSNRYERYSTRLRCWAASSVGVTLDEMDESLAAVRRHLDGAANLLNPLPFSPRQHNWALAMLGCVQTQVEEYRQCLAEWRSAMSTIQVADLIIAM